MRVAQNQKLDMEIIKAKQVCKILYGMEKNTLADKLGAEIKNVMEQRFLIGVVGAAKRGKSTLINGLLGRQNDNCAPIGKFPATNVTSIFGYSATSSAKVIFIDGSQPINESEIRLYVTEEHNSNNNKKVRSVEVFGPFPGLEEGVFIVDTPGTNNTLSFMHGEILLEFLPVADAIIFLVTADNPLIEAEQKLLKGIKGENIKKLFFAVNKIDRVKSGDIEPEELAQGVDHNRRILSEVGFSDATIYEISARDYFESQSNPGTERMLSAIREMISNEKHSLMIEHLCYRTKSILKQAFNEMETDLNESKATNADLEVELKALESTKQHLKNDRSVCQRCFMEEWYAAFDELQEGLQNIKKELVTEYSELIDRTSALNIQPLSQTIHADVHVSFSERFLSKLEQCEKSINEAVKNLNKSAAKSTEKIMMTSNLNIADSKTIKSTIKDSLKIGSAATPAIVTGAVAAAFPGMVSNMMIAATPAVSAIAGNPATWPLYAGTALSSAALSGMGAVVTTCLSVIAAPLAIGAFGLAGLRVYTTWKENNNMHKNELKTMVIKLVNDGSSQTMKQIEKYRKMQANILTKFEQTLENSIDEKENHIRELIEKRPTQKQIQMLERGVENINQQIKFLEDTSKDINNDTSAII